MKKKTLTYVAFFLIGIIFSLTSSLIVSTIGCGSFRLLDCGIYAGWPVPYLKYNYKLVENNPGKEMVNPTIYFKNRFSPIRENRVYAEKFLSDGVILPFFLLDYTYYDFETGLFMVNLFIWLLPSGFLIGIFF